MITPAFLMLIKAQYEEFAKFTDFSLLNKELNVDPFRFVYYSQEAMDRAEYSNPVFLPKDMNAPGISCKDIIFINII